MLIKRKLTVIICSSILVTIIIGISLVYLLGSSLLSKNIGKQYVQIAQLLGDYLADNFKDEIEDTKVYATLPLWVDIVKDANAKYNNMGAKDIELYFEDMDKKWISAQKGDPVFWEYMDNRISVAMRDIEKLRGGVSELFITDKYGGVVATSGKTSDFCQSDEGWWKAAYNNGKGGTYVSNMEFDESSESWVISIAAPMRDEKNEVVGICKNSININRLFKELNLLKIGETGHAVLTDSEGNIIFHNDIPVMEEKFCGKEEMGRLLSKKEKFFIKSRVVVHDENSFCAYSVVKLPHLSDKGIYWVIFVSQDSSETFAPLYKFIGLLVLITLVLLVISIPIGTFFGGMVAKPIHELRIATEHVLAGDWDYRIEVHTGDEIEHFADTFKSMIMNIKEKQERLESFSHGLEEKVKARTSELTRVQEATLNILEDLAEAKKFLEKSNRELKQLDQLKSDFISTVSHELRTPLSIIKEGISLVLDRVPGDINEKQVKILDISKFNIDRLARIIDGLLDISKIEAGKVDTKKALIDMSALATDVARSFEIKIKEKGLELKLDIDQNAGSVYADPDKITQVMVNLMGNAIKFTSSGYIEVSCKSKGDDIVVSVKDTGTGISKDDFPKLFNKFQQFGRVAGAGEKGTGLGLSIVKGIIDMHNGSISVESEPSMGSRFTFSLRKYTEESLFSEAVAKAAENAAKNRSKVSLVLICMRYKDKQDSSVVQKNFHAAISDCSRMMKNTLRRQGDELIISNEDVLVILADCNKEHSLLVRQRFDKIVHKCFDEKNILDKVDIKYGLATFPDDGKMYKDLLAKAGACLSGHFQA
ncbi:MAG: ATP-binding protein [Candidatus Omnitrophota bacterium]|jgi:signal transduction histidine kinase/GGDEF domain-containing protein